MHIVPVVLDVMDNEDCILVLLVALEKVLMD